jgi:carbonic anhydrase/acetyltransferase-like protein (isoleucine patch superfamily)
MRVVHYFGKALRETGQAMDRFGLALTDTESFRETFTRHRTLVNMIEKSPSVGIGSFVAPCASVIGAVQLGENASVWYGTVLRADVSAVKIGANTNVQDRTVMNTVPSIDIVIGDHVTIGHGALLTSCTVADKALIGQGSIIQTGCSIGSESIIAAGAVVLPNTTVPPGQVWAGNPATFMRDVTAEDKKNFAIGASHYVSVAAEHNKEFDSFKKAYAL